MRGRKLQIAADRDVVRAARSHVRTLLGELGDLDADDAREMAFEFIDGLAMADYITEPERMALRAEVDARVPARVWNPPRRGRKDPYEKARAALRAGAARKAAAKKDALVIVMNPGGAPRAITVPLDLRTLQSLVGGYIERVPLRRGVDVLVNEEFLLLGLPYNLSIDAAHGPVDIYGPIVIVANHRGEIAGLRREDADELLEQLQKLRGVSNPCRR